MGPKKNSTSAPASKPSKTADMEELLSYLQRSQKLLTQLLESVTNPQAVSASNFTADQRRTNPLNVLRDSGKLLKAHTTKLSLMILNKPFGAKSVHGELKASIEQCIMGMMGGLDIMACPWQVEDKGSKQSIWGHTMVKEARARVTRVIREVSVMVQEVRSIAEKEAGIEVSPSEGAQASNRDSLASTGVVWEACDALVELDKMGVPGLAVLKATQYYQTLKDALAELKEWAQEAEDEDDDEDDGGFSDDDDDEIFQSMKLSKDNVALRELLNIAIKKISMIGLLYQALLKRRVKPFACTFPPDSGGEEVALNRIRRLDQLLDLLKMIPDQADELACAFYDLDEEAAKSMFAELLKTASAAASTNKLDWNQQEDTFTSWSEEWENKVRSTGDSKLKS